jgi:hypothetical protein
MKVLVACEFSGVVRDAFTREGHYAMSCDFLPTELPGPHHRGGILEVINQGWDLMIAHPPCTYLSSSGLHWNKRIKGRENKTIAALSFVQLLMGANIPKICVENPVGCISTRIRKPEQYIQPWQFGHGETKKTCLWLKNLPLLLSTNIVKGREARVHKMPPSLNRWKDRSRTYTGIAEAMAEQWS